VNSANAPPRVASLENMAQDSPPAEKHVISLLFHFFFKTTAVVWFILCTWFVSSFVINFVVSIILIALDFWTVSSSPSILKCPRWAGVSQDSNAAKQVKNVTGRKLVGLRWWNEANDSGSAWRFESAPEVHTLCVFMASPCFLIIAIFYAVGLKDIRGL
jgi:hypothetical protein